MAPLFVNTAEQQCSANFIFLLKIAFVFVIIFLFSIRCGIGVLMFNFFKKLLIELKLKRVLNFFDKADQCFSVFQKINLIDVSLLKTINEMSSFSEYEHIVCKFNEYVHRINEHNISVKTTIKKNRWHNK